MTLQNRVDPFGRLRADPVRGAWTGNRGVLHDEARTIRRQWQVRRWITCRLEFRGRHREIMRPGRWTELFFLDEATALAAGHRPCAECRNADYRRFRALWAGAHPGDDAGADAIDVRLHAERVGPGRAKRTHRARAGELPDGAFVAEGGAPYLVLGRWLLAWAPGGYTGRRARPAGEVELLTPPGTVAVLRAGYHPHMHETARTWAS